jgi:hypothetical protein
MTLNAILAALKHPKARAAYVHNVQDVLPSAKYLRDGSERVAYQVGRWVVKKQNHRPRPPVKALRAVGVHPPTQWLVNGWQVQPRYRRLRYTVCKQEWAAADLDLGGHNIGKDRYGRYVAFDW